MPERTPCPSALLGGPDLEVCYEPAEAWRLAALLEALVDVYDDVAACAAAAPELEPPAP